MDFLKKDQLPGSSSMKSALSSNVWALWTIRIVLVIYASFGAPNLNKAGALFFNNMIVRLVLAILIIYLCYVDPTSAILLAVSFVVSVQTLNKYRLPSSSEDSLDTFVDNMPPPSEEDDRRQPPSRGPPSRGPPSRGPPSRGQPSGGQPSGGQPSGGQPSRGPSSGGQPHSGPHSGPHSSPHSGPHGGPHHESFTQHMLPSEESSDMSTDHSTFTSQEQLHDAQVNTVQSDQVSQVQTWREQLGPQGLNNIKGYNIESNDNNSGSLAPF